MSIINLDCPMCRMPIKIDIDELLRGAAFTCESCKTDISITPENKEVLQNAMDQFDTFKKTHQPS